jgi:hypothetical protein
LPYASVTPGPGGVLYGTAISGGKLFGTSDSPYGVVYSMTPLPAPSTGYAYKVLHSFDFSKGGGDAMAGVTVDPSGVLYGITEVSAGGAAGVIYKLTPPKTGATNWVETEYGLGATGYSGAYRMIQDSTGALYGGTEGEIFKYQP